MQSRDRYLAYAICASVALHVALLWAAALRADNWRVFLPPLHRAPTAIAISLVRPPDPDEEVGDRAGTGTGSDNSEGEQPLQAEQAELDQPLLDRDPQGPKKIADAQSPDAHPGERGHGGQAGGAAARAAQESHPQVAMVTPLTAPKAADESAEPVKVTAPLVEQPEPPPQTGLLASVEEAALPTPTAPSLTEKLTNASKEPSPPQPHAPSPDVSSESTPQVASGDGLAPGDAVRTSPAQQSDSQYDAFRKVGSAEFHNGKLTIRSGRRIRPTRPNLTVAGMLDVFGARDPSVLLKISVDATGKVTLVEVVESSGRNDIDQPVQVAVYDWWIEPARDRQGRAVPDVILFRISFR